jgi:hypothetical protein
MDTTGSLLSPRHRDYGTCALAMVLCAVAISLANNVDLYDHLGAAVFGLSLGIAACAAANILPSLRRLNFSQRGLAAAIGAGVLLQIVLLQKEVDANVIFNLCAAAVAALALPRLVDRPWQRMASLAALAMAFFIAAVITIHRPQNVWTDVLMSQQKGCDYLLRGVNPFAATYPNIYGPNTPLYAPGMVDANNHLKFGFGYPPLSLLMVMPSYLLAGDVRYALAAALAASALLMGIVNRGRLGVAAAAAFLAAPQWPRMLLMGWTEPLLILNFSLVMFCACRWRPGLPWALGLFLATKQYAIVALPVLPLLIEPRKLPKALLQIGAALAIINLPFCLWNPAAFWRSLITAHALQSFRPDALSYPAWIYRRSAGWVLPTWAALSAIALASGEALWRGVRSPAGFAAAATLVLLLFFAFNKQAFCNYYYFLAASAWWSVAAARLSPARMAITLDESAVCAKISTDGGRHAEAGDLDRVFA